MASGDTKTQEYLDVAANGTRADLPSDTCCETRTQTLIRGVAERVMDVEDEVDELKNNPDVVDIVATYADLQAYDTQHLTNNDIIRVLQDETHSGNSTYYRFTKNPDTWTFIGEISGGSGPTVVQSTGTSTTDVMSQDATTKMIYSNSQGSITIPLGVGFPAPANNSISLGDGSSTGQYSVTIGTGFLYNTKGYGVAIGYGANNTGGQYAVALGAYSSAWDGGVVSIGDSSGTYTLYNNTPYRKIVNVYDGENPHDAATVGQLNGRVLQNAGAPTTSTVGTVGQLLEDTTNGKLYQCTAVSGSTYTWTEVGAGGGGSVNVVQTTGTSTTDVMSQNAATSMVFQNGATDKIQIGLSANAGTANGGVAIGANSSATGLGAIALGDSSVASGKGVMSIGPSNIYRGYNNSNYRLLTGLYDPQNDHDAATKGYVDTAISGISVGTISNNTLYL